MIRKVLLLNPPMRLEQVYGWLTEWGGASPATGLTYIASVLRKNGFDVSIIDAEASKLDFDKTLAAITNFKPDIIGIACKSLWIVNAHKVASELKKRLPGIPIVAGGNHPTALPKRTLKEFSNFDFLIAGEGEITFLELIKALNNNVPLQQINGLAFSEDNNIRINPPRPRIQDLDRLGMPAYDLLPDLATHYNPALTSATKLPAFSIVTSRGCPAQCTFCDRSVFGNRITSHSPEYTVSLIRELYYKHRIRYILFDDDNLLLNKPHLFKILDLLEKENFKIPFTCQSRVDTIDEERLKRLKKAGCKIILYGIESGSQKILDMMKKNITVPQIQKAVKLTKKHGILTQGFFILGYPGETEGTVQETIKLIKECPFDEIGVWYFTPLPGSEIYANVKNYGEYTEDWEKMNSIDEILFIPEGLTKNKLKEYMDKIYNAQYLKPSQILFSYKKFHTMAHLKAAIKPLFKLIFKGRIQ